MMVHGRYIKMYEDKKNEFAAKDMCFDMEFEGLPSLVINRIGESSHFFDSVFDNRKYKLIVQFGFVGDGWRLSFRTQRKTIDCAKIAEKFGGGGHKKAAGAFVKGG
jgi:hypothetical protein